MSIKAIEMLDSESQRLVENFSNAAQQWGVAVERLENQSKAWDSYIFHKTLLEQHIIKLIKEK